MSSINILHIGDLVGEQGVEAIQVALPDLKKELNVHFCIANGENSHEGRGINEVIVKRLYKAGVDVITGGDHSFDKHLIFPYMTKDNRLLRPFNYPRGVPGFGFGTYKVNGHEDLTVSVINLRGNSYFNNPVRCPFQSLDFVLGELDKQSPTAIFVDFHAEATAEKKAFGWYADGKVSVVSGTHTHVQTADNTILPHGTGYLTDVGFTGAHHSVIGMSIEVSINRYLLQIPQKYTQGFGDVRINAALFTVSVKTGKTTAISLINRPVTVNIQPPSPES